MRLHALCSRSLFSIPPAASPRQAPLHRQPGDLQRAQLHTSTPCTVPAAPGDVPSLKPFPAAWGGLP